MSAQLLLLRSMEQKLNDGTGEKTGIVINDMLLDGKALQLPTKGCINWEIHNTGDVVCYLWNVMKLNPNDSYKFDNYSKETILNLVPLRWDGTFVQSRNIADAGNLQQSTT